MKQGMDREVVYVRETSKIELPAKYELGYVHTFSTARFQSRLHLLGFCGEIYHIFEIFDKDNLKRSMFHDLETFKELAINLSVANSNDFRESRWWPSKYQNFVTQNVTDLKEFHHTYQVPIFLLSPITNVHKTQLLTLNPSLRDLEFQQIKDTYTTYQDIFQFVAGTLNKPENKMVKISDKDKIHKHGFDKWSFRKMPTKKK
jgi:hypothetical protein